MGPYVIHDLSTSGAVHLATLDGEPIANWISGCRIKKFHEPLTQEILARLHAAKSRKERLENAKQEAQAEAKARALKLRQRQRPNVEDLNLSKKLRICQLTGYDGEDYQVRPNVIVLIGKEQKRNYALVDSGADVNAISHDTWISLREQPELHHTKLKVASFAGDRKGAIGYCDLDVVIGQTNVRHRFYVMKPGRMNSPMLLGTPWQRSYKSSTNWHKDGIDYAVNNQRFF